MKSFRFSLDRVLVWRNSQLTMEESKLERLRGEAESIRRRQVSVTESRTSAESAVLQSSTLSGADLTNLELLRNWARSEHRRLAESAAAAATAISQQQTAVTEARRRVRLLERLKERRHAAWSVAQENELAELASESAIAQWRRAN